MGRILWSRVPVFHTPSLGYQPYEGKWIHFSAELGPEMVQEEYRSGAKEDSPAVGWQTHSDQFIVPATDRLYHRQIGLEYMDETSQGVFPFSTGVRVPVYGGFSVSSKVQLDYQSEPDVSVDEIHRVKAGYGW